MKSFFIFLFVISIQFTNSQTKLSQEDINAARGNDYENLLIGVPTVDTSWYIQGFTYPKTLWEAKIGECGDNCQSIVIGNNPVGDQDYSYLEVKMYYNKIGERWMNLITNKVIITGDMNLLIQFFTEFWSRTLNWYDVKKGDVVSTRFLTDIAVFSFDENGNPQIIVEGTKDYYKED